MKSASNGREDTPERDISKESVRPVNHKVDAMNHGVTVSFGNVEKGILFAIKKQIRAYLKSRMRGDDLPPPRIWEDERKITFPGWSVEQVRKALDYAYDRMGPAFRRINPEVADAIASDLGQKEAEEDEGASEQVETATPGERGAPWQQHLIDKTRRETSEAYEEQIRRQDTEHAEQLRREQAKATNLQRQVDAMRTDRDRLQKEKDEAERARKTVEEHNDNLIKSLTSFADDPSKAALQVVSRAASWIRRLENQMKELGEPPEQSPLGEYFQTAEQDLLEYANSLLGPAGKTVQSIDELQSLAVQTPWEESEFHKAHAAEYLKAREEHEFIQGVESGKIHVPDSFKDLLTKAGDPTLRSKAIESYETEQATHKQKLAAGSVATTATRMHEYSRHMRALVQNRVEKDPLPIAVVYRADGSDQSIQVRVPVGLETGLLSSSILEVIEKAAVSAGFRVEKRNGTGKEPALHLSPIEGNLDRVDLLRKQGAFREGLTKLLEDSPLKKAGVGFRIIDLRDFAV